MSDRKYKHSGYMDSGRDDRSNRQSGGKSGGGSGDDRKPRSRQPSDLPRPGRGMERSASEVQRCSSCGNSLPPAFVVSTDSACPGCNSSLHCCRNCTHFDTSARFECRQPIPKAVPAKGAANECEEFHMRAVLDATGRRARSPEDTSSDPRKAFDALFKK